MVLKSVDLVLDHDPCELMSQWIYLLETMKSSPDDSESQRLFEGVLDGQLELGQLVGALCSHHYLVSLS